jgi:streptogrisin D
VRIRTAAISLVVVFSGLVALPSSAPAASCLHVAPPPAEAPVDERVATGLQNAIRAGEPLNAMAQPVSGLPYGLVQGIIGIVGSVDTGFKLVVDDTVFDERRFAALLEKHLPPGGAAAIEFEHSCRSSLELAVAWKRLGARTWHPEAHRTTFVTDVDPALEQITVGMNPLTTRAAVLQAALDVNPHVVRVEPSPSLRASRLNDSPNGGHWGGARVTSSVEICSAGFSVVRRSNGTRASVTAGHCGPNGTRWRSGSHYYGTGAGRHNYPDYDQQLLVGSTYGPRIWTDGDDTTDVRVVRGARDAAVGQKICASGSYTRSVCGIRVDSLSARYCDADGCTTYVMRGTRSGSVIVRTGDSGGPVYSKRGSGGATIRGMIFAGTGCYSSGCRTIFAERYESIAGHLSIRVLTD